jgi:hypothetical protein
MNVLGFDLFQTCYQMQLLCVNPDAVIEEAERAAKVKDILYPVANSARRNDRRQHDNTASSCACRKEATGGTAKRTRYWYSYCTVRVP